MDLTEFEHGVHRCIHCGLLSIPHDEWPYDWCGPCVRMGHHLRRQAELRLHAEKVTAWYVNVTLRVMP